MKERPILFSAPMVRAILDGRKTQTRRVIKPQPRHDLFEVCNFHKSCVDRNGNLYPSIKEYFGICDIDGDWSVKCPFGTVGDRLWVRETAKATATEEGIDCIQYMADDHCRQIMVSEYGPWRKMRSYSCGHARAVPSIHMPRWASRINLEVAGIRVERLNEISPKDAIAEGCMPSSGSGLGTPENFREAARLVGGPYPRGIFAMLWESINGPGSWAANPWVWVVEFRRVEQ